jgi:hypothetical protein
VIFDLTVTGNKEVTAHLRGMAERADATRLFRAMAPELYEAQERKFRAGWSKSKLVSYRRHTVTRGKNKGRQTIRDVRDVTRYTLVDTGDLRESLTNREDERNILRITPVEMTFGTDVYYAKFLVKRGFRLPFLDLRTRKDMRERARVFLLRGDRS